jgi:hypothetical protein
MSRKKKIVIVVAFATVFIAAGIAAVLLNIKETQEGFKKFQVEIISERDDFHKITVEESVLLFLGEYLHTMEGCQYDTMYGTFVTGWHGMEQDHSKEYWWSVSVNGEDSLVGVDDIPLNEGDVYTFTLLQGYN